MESKAGLILGISTTQSVGYVLAKHLIEKGYRVVISFENEAMKSRMSKHFSNDVLNDSIIYDFCLSKKLKIGDVFKKKHKNLRIDFAIHCVAKDHSIAKKEKGAGSISKSSKENFINTVHDSAWSFVELFQSMNQFCNKGTSFLTFSYIGSSKWIDGYSLMGSAKCILERVVFFLSMENGCFKFNSISIPARLTTSSRPIRGIMDIIKKQNISGELLSDDDLCSAVCFLISNKCKINGQNIIISKNYKEIYKY